MTQPLRLPRGGTIDRTKPLHFTFNGQSLCGYAGDTLASALLANGVNGVARSLKYHRLRGIYTAGPEEPSALVRVGDGERTVPNQAATLLELYEGIEGRSLNCWPSVRWDVGRINDFLSALLPAGFYYKTFMWPSAGWMIYERVIRRAAGLAHTPACSDSARYTKHNVTVDVLVVGAGCAGLAAALAAARSGASVIVCERDPVVGGQLRWRDAQVAANDARDIAGVDAHGGPGVEWIDQALSSLRALPNVQLMTRTTAVGYYDHNLVTLVERVTDHLPDPPAHLPRERLWKVRARRVVLATGSFERLLVFPGNDLPGVMLASAAQRYVGQFAVAPGRRAVLFTNNDSAYDVVRALRAAQVEVVAVVDVRPEGSAAAVARAGGLRVDAGSVIAAVTGGSRVSGVRIVAGASAGGADGKETALACDCVLVAGGWDPAVHLYSQSGGRLAFDREQQCFVPGPPAQPVTAAGSANGVFDAGDCTADGTAAGIEAALGFGSSSHEPTSRPARRPLVVDGWPGASKPGIDKSFVDLQSDVTAADLRLAAREGFTAAEHAKRYTTTGMGIDQGKVGNIAALAVLGAATGRAVPDVGTTTFRPPFVPVTLGTLAGRDIGALFDPVRETPIGDWHDKAGAVLEPVGLWRRPSWYPRSGEDRKMTIARECRAVRERAGLLDASTLGKIEITGPDAATFLNRVYTNGWSGLGVGQCRYGLMLRENGMVFDDGVCARLGEHHYLMSSTSGNADAVEHWLEEWLQCEWSDLAVQVVAVTAAWATLSLAGPHARKVLAGCESDIDFSATAFPHLAVRCGRIAGVAARVLRVSYTGELSYEINVPARFGRALWERVLERGATNGLEPVGLRAIDALRIEKGFIAVGHDTDGTVTPGDLGMDWIVSRKKGDFVGRRSLERPDAARAGRKQLVGLLTADGAIVPREGSPVVTWADVGRIGRPPVPMIGHVSSSADSVVLRRSIALALLENGRLRIGERVAIVDRGRPLEAVIVAPRFYDAEGARLNV